jgi:hypothetical protein
MKKLGGRNRSRINPPKLLPLLCRSGKQDAFQALAYAAYRDRLFSRTEPARSGGVG